MGVRGKNACNVEGGREMGWEWEQRYREGVTGMCSLAHGGVFRRRGMGVHRCVTGLLNHTRPGVY